MITQAPGKSREQISTVLSGESLRYAQVWEDSETARVGLALHEHDDLVSICGAGCNVLAMLLSRPRRVLAVDLNPAQTALLDLKLAALGVLEHADFITLLGARPHADRLALYERVRPGMPDAARAYWDAHSAEVTSGIMGSGRLERYFRAFQVAELHRADRAPLIAALLRAEDRAGQRSLFNQLEASGLRAPFVDYFSRESMARRGRHHAQFQHVDVVDVGEWFWNRLRYACTELPTLGNWYLEWFLTSNYQDLESGPWYLRPQHYDQLRSLANRVSVVTGDVIELLRDQPRAHSKANFSDIFEYLSVEETGEALEVIADALVPGGRVCYWNLLVSRERPRTLARRLRPRGPLGERLWKHDRSWFYRAVRVEEVIA